MFGRFHLNCLIIASFLGVCASAHVHAGDTKTSSRTVSLKNANTGEKITIQLITQFGTINNRSRQIVSRMLSPQNSGERTTLLHPRLLLMLQRVADQYSGRQIEIVSGYRLATKGHSDEHDLGRAIDFRIAGVKNEKLYDFLKTLPKCGTGYYPKSNFVHLDVREETATWVDFFHTNTDCQVAASTEKHTGTPVPFLSVWDNVKMDLQLVTESGAINNRSRRLLSQLANSRAKTPRTVLLHPRLILMLQRVSDQFPGHRIEIISGHRLAEKGWHSYHNFGRAVDFRVDGIDNTELYAFIRTLPKCGTGYYPNSVFVHLDVRDKATVWTDYSGVGEASQYKKQK